VAAKPASRRRAIAALRNRKSDESDRLLLVVSICAFTLLFGYLLKAQCLSSDWTLGQQYQRLCYNDIQPLYPRRGIAEKQFPYVDGDLVDGELINGAIEYPVLTGVFMWASGLPVEDERSYFRISALLLAPFGLAVAFMLGKMRDFRAFFWAAAPGLVLYAFHNWDLLVVAAAVAGIWLAERRRPEWAAVAFGVGAALKMYPLLFVVPLAIWCYRSAGVKKALGVAGAGIGTFLLINLPFMVASPGGWLITYQFHSDRGPNFDSIWWFGFEALGWEPWSPSALNVVTTSLLAVSVVAALAYGWARGKAEGAYPWLQVAAAMLAAFLLFNKVHSPQYTLWLLPFFALLPVRWYWWAAYAIADLAVYVGIFRWFYDWTLTKDFDEVTFAKGAVMAGVWARALLLGALFVVFLRSRTGEREVLAESQEMSHPAPSMVH
jgi:uncharacterized membrane protein